MSKLLAICFLFIFCGVCWAEQQIDINRLTNAIYKAEGGNRTAHPYGILKHYKHTMPRQACINTIKSALKHWNRKEDFIHFLSLTYCPIGAKNDPKGLNVNWERNVKKFYREEE